MKKIGIGTMNVEEGVTFRCVMMIEKDEDGRITDIRSDSHDIKDSEVLEVYKALREIYKDVSDEKLLIRAVVLDYQTRYVDHRHN